MNIGGFEVIMKIIVDEMPVFRDECPFCKMDFGEYICSRSDL